MDDLSKIDLLACSQLVDSLGGEGLPASLLTFLQPYIDADTLQFYCFHRSASGEIVDIDYFGAAAKNDDSLAKIDAGGRGYLLHLQDYRRACPDFRLLKNLSNDQAVWVRNPEDFSDLSLRAFNFGNGRVAQFCTYANATAHHTYALWLGRLQGAPLFNDEELGSLLQLSPLLAPLLIKHAELAPVSLSLGQQANGLRQRLERKLADSMIELSVREQEVCLGILLGQQAPGMAVRLGVAATSITTYKKRAFAKIGVSTRQGLFNWCFLPGASFEQYRDLS